MPVKNRGTSILERVFIHILPATRSISCENNVTDTKKTRKDTFWLLLIAVGVGLMLVISGCAGNSPNNTLDNYPGLFEKDTLIVLGENATPIELDGAKLIAYDISNLTGYTPVIKNDTEVTEAARHDNNMILVGRAETNKVLKDVYGITNATRVTDKYPGAGKGILEVRSNPWNESKAMLFVEGSDEWGVRAGSVVLEDEQQLRDKKKIFVDWKEATGITIPINNSEDAIKYAKIDADVKKYIKQHSAHYSIEANNLRDLPRKEFQHIDIWIVRINIGSFIPEDHGEVGIYPNGTFRYKQLG